MPSSSTRISNSKKVPHVTESNANAPQSPASRQLPPLATDATHITFYDDRARVERRASLDLYRAGTYSLRLTGVTRYIQDRSLRVSLSDDATLLLAQVRRELSLVAPTTYMLGRKKVTSFKDAQKQTQTIQRIYKSKEYQKSKTEQHLARTHERIDHLHKFQHGILSQMALVPGGPQCTPETFSQSLDMLEQELNQTQAQETQLHLDLIKLERERLKLEERLEQSLHRSQEIVAYVDIQFSCEGPCTVEFSLDYVTGAAMWRPSHLARLQMQEPESNRGQIHVETRAMVWQRTGEHWQDVECSFSTARPTQSTSPPGLQERVLSTRARGGHSVSRRANATTSTSSSRTASPGRGAVTTTLQAMHPVSIPDTGRAYPVPLEHVQIPCEVDTVAFPELSETPYLRARTIWSHDKPMLAGPVMIVRGTEHMGQFVIEHKNPGDRLDLGFGTVDTLSVRREMSKRTLSQEVTRPRQECKILHYVSNTSPRPHQLHIIERIPTSRELKTTILTPEQATPNEDGLLETEVVLEPNQTARLELVYELEARPAIAY